MHFLEYFLIINITNDMLQHHIHLLTLVIQNITVNEILKFLKTAELQPFSLQKCDTAEAIIHVCIQQGSHNRPSVNDTKLETK